MCASHELLANPERFVGQVLEGNDAVEFILQHGFYLTDSVDRGLCAGGETLEFMNTPVDRIERYISDSGSYMDSCPFGGVGLYVLPSEGEIEARAVSVFVVELDEFFVFTFRGRSGECDDLAFHYYATIRARIREQVLF